MLIKTPQTQKFNKQQLTDFLSINLLTYPLLHFVSPIFINQLTYRSLTKNLVSSVSFVSHFRETNSA
ncbi:MAG: hypothetical protein JWR50_2571 [Mucilaginibacter sp.]|nr:hypothetical protein [Mucilaginibacter sp.]